MTTPFTNGASDWATTRGDKWRDHVERMEATVHPLLDPLIAALHLALHPDVPHTIADIACGGGATTLELLRRAPPGTVVHGHDISPSLIEHARARTAPDPRLAFHLGDVSTATPSAPYDRLFSRFGIMFFDDPPAAFENLARWLTPGGRFAFAVWGPPSDNPWLTTIVETVAAFIDLPAPDPHAPGPFRYANPEPLLALLAAAGLGDLTVAPWRGTLPLGGGLSPADTAHFALAALANFGELLAQAGPPTLAHAHQSLTAKLTHHQRDGAVVMDASVHIITGTRASAPP